MAHTSFAPQLLLLPLAAFVVVSAVAAPKDSYTYMPGFLAAGDDLPGGSFTFAEATAHCDELVDCVGITFAAGPDNRMPSSPVNMFFKSVVNFEASSTWTTWVKTPPPEWPDKNTTVGDLKLSLRAGSHSVAILGLSDPSRDWSSWHNFSWVPPTPSVGLPGCHTLGDITLRTQPLSSTNASAWALFSSAWGSFAVPATPLPAPPGAIAVDDITPLLDATPPSHRLQPQWGDVPLRVTRSYEDSGAPLHTLIIRVNITATSDVRVGGFGFSMISNELLGGDLDTIARVNSLADPHMGGEHGYAEWIRMTGNESLLFTPATRDTRFEAWRPLFEDCNYGGWQHEWVVLSGAWAAEWATQRQAPVLSMPQDLVDTGVWGPHPATPFPAWRLAEVVGPLPDPEARLWNPATTLELRDGESASFALRVSLAPAGPRTTPRALVAVGEPALRGIPGFTLSTDTASAFLFVDLPMGSPPPATATSTPLGLLTFSPWVLALNASTPSSRTFYATVAALAPGRARVSILLADGSEAVAHYHITPPFAQQVAAAGAHWAEVAWLPREYADPFGRSASVMPYDRQDAVHALDDSRAYVVGLSDDAGAAQNLGFATKVGFAPLASEVARVDEYIDNTLYGVKPDVASPPLRSLQVRVDDSTDAIRMTMYYYCATPGNCTSANGHFNYSFPEQNKCDVAAGSPNWCMTENMADATYRGFNVPHSTAVWLAMYRVARHYDRIATSRTWDAYLARAVALANNIGQASVGFMDGTVFRELLDVLIVEAADGNATICAWRDALDHNMRARALAWSTVTWPYGSEFAYDTTGQEEVFVWLSRFGYAAAANRTLEAVLGYMRAIPHWAWHAGARSGGDLGNNGKWLINRGGERMLLHYRSGLNQIVLTEAYRANPDDTFLLTTAMGALTGQLGNILPATDARAPGAVSMGFHTFPGVNEFDPRSGDFGLGFFGISLEAASFLVTDAALPSGWACYLCTLLPGATPVRASLLPTDGYRIRVYLEPLGTSLILQTGAFQRVDLYLDARTARITLAPAASAPASLAGAHAEGARPFSVFRLVVQKDAPLGVRPGTGWVLTDAAGHACDSVRGAFVVPPNADDAVPTVATLTWE